MLLCGSLPPGSGSTDGVTDSLTCSLRFFDSEVEFKFAGLEVIDDGVIPPSLNQLIWSACSSTGLRRETHTSTHL